MVESARLHERLPKKEFQGIRTVITSVLPKQVEVFLSKKNQRSTDVDLLIHFLGADYVVQNAMENYRGSVAAALVNLGAGSKVFGDAFEDTTKFLELVDSIKASLHADVHHQIHFRKIILSGFSAGYGSIRRIMSLESNYRMINGVLLLDGIHAGYIPDRKVLAEGGIVDSTDLSIFGKLAEDATRKNSQKRFLITHSEIFPGTYASTTESTDYLLRKLQIKRKPVLRWGALGMQQLSEAKKNHFAVMGFAGNTAPDHVDHLQALSYFLNLLSKL